MRTLLLSGALALLLPLAAAAQDAHVKKQTANTADQTVVDTPATEKEKANEHMTDAMNTKKGAHDPRPRDEHGTPKPQPLKGQGTNSSSDAMRAADKAGKP